MRTSLCIALAILALTIAAGFLTAGEIRQVSERYVSAAEELRSMTEHGEWPRAEETVQAYIDSWRKTVPLLQTIINHDDTDDVTMALLTLQAAVHAEALPGCFAACAELRENAQHLYHRDAFTLANVL